MARVRLIHWNKSESALRADELRKLGHTVSASPLAVSTLIREINQEMPDALVIDLTRLPSQGCSVGIRIRQSRKRDPIALVFAGGAPAKVAAVRKLLPGALYCDWDSIGELLQALQPPAVPDRPLPMSEFTNPVARKLGLKNGITIALVGEPEGFLEQLGGLPEDLQVLAEPASKCELLFWFPRGREDFLDRLDWIATRQKKPRFWILWPKRTSNVKSGLSQPSIRSAAAGVGLTDYRVCSVDSTWSALLFTTKKA